MAGEYNRFVKQAQTALSHLDSPRFVREAEAEDLHPSNVENLQRAIGERRHRGALQQQVLGDELKRIKALQTQQLQQAAKQMPQQLQQSLSPAKTGEPFPSPEAMMVRMMLQMQRRYPGMQGGPAPQQPF